MRLHHLLGAGVLSAAFAATTTLGTSLAGADETCMSPCMAKISGQEDFAHVWTLGIGGVGDGQDKLVTSAANPSSPDYGEVATRPITRATPTTAATSGPPAWIPASSSSLTSTATLSIRSRSTKVPSASSSTWSP